jgi:hypothetical protein
MSEHEQPTPPPHPTVRVARDLTEIVDLHARLAAQAENEASHALMPGGNAMVALGNVANIEAWENHHQATERYARAYTSVVDEDPDEAWSAFQLLEFWSEQWRRQRDAEYDDAPRPTIETEANFLRWSLEWAWQNEPAWDDFAADINRARVRLEDIVHAGNRVELSRIVCPDCDPSPPRLIVLRGTADDGSDDRWKCHRCRNRFDSRGAQRAHAKMLRSAGAERWVHQADAIATLKAQGRPERTIRQWLAEGEGCGYCDPETHEVWVWWPDLWRKHLSTPTRKRSA